MKPSLALATHRTEIREIVLAHRALNARVFGSVAQGLDTELSDLDILVDTTSETTLFDLGAIRCKLRNLLGVPVDVMTPWRIARQFSTDCDFTSSTYMSRDPLRLRDYLVS